jgi:5-methylcytosine-specific restriction endonuclease McrA
MKEGRLTLSTVVDHIRPHKGDVALFWDSNNLQTLCTGCHNAGKQSIEVRGYDKAVGMDGWPLYEQTR